jgi:hypothetical protein
VGTKRFKLFAWSNNIKLLESLHTLGIALVGLELKKLIMKIKLNKQLRQERMIRPSSTFIQYL